MTEFESRLKEQLERLSTDCIAFDSINECAYANISVTLRSIFCDTTKQESLLTKLHLKEQLRMLDTSLKPGTNSFWSLGDNFSNQTIVLPDIYGGLVAKEAVLSDGKKLYHYKPLATHPQYAQYEKNSIQEERFLSVKDWLEKVIYDDKKGVKLSRYDLIKEVANKDGGAHIDEDAKKSKEYLQFRSCDGLGISVNGKRDAFSNNPVPSSLRQMAQEVLTSMQIANLKLNK